MNSNEDWVIDANHLRKEFNGRVAVNDVSLQVRRGEIFGFLGPNGSGKTTTIRMLCGLLTPDKGSGTCLGYDLLKESKYIKSHVGYMTQKFSLYEELSVYENLDFIARMYDLTPRKSIVEQAIAHLGLGHDRQQQLAGSLSGGWKQRLALAAATIHQPKLLLLDEPTAGVDPKARREFWEHIYLLSEKGVTTLVSTHYMDEAERCHRLAYIAYGELLAYGRIDEVIEQANLTTYEVRGPNLMALENQLRQLPQISEVTTFGQSLHVSGEDKTALQQVATTFTNNTHSQWRLISTTLEDVFIHFMKYADEKMMSKLKQ